MSQLSHKFTVSLCASLTRRLAIVFVCFLYHATPLFSASFPGNTRLEINDTTGGLSWNAAKNGLSVQAWFKISVPSGASITEDMTILVNRKSGSPSAHAYLIFFNRHWEY